MTHEIKTLPQSQVEIKLEISPDDMPRFLEKAARKISETKEIPGYRKGKASVDAVTQAVGEMALWQEAAEPAIISYLNDILKEQKIDTVGHPRFDIEKIAPGNPLVVKATLSTIPDVELGSFSDISVTKEVQNVEDAQIDETIEELRNMRRSEAAVDREVKAGDKVDVSLKVTQGGKQIDSQEKISVDIDAKRYIPGFEDQLLGLKKGDKKEFELTFPKDYRAQEVAGKSATFAVEVLDVFELSLPELNDEFAVSVGKVATIEDLKKDLRRNLETEAEKQADQKLENDLIAALVEKSTIGDVPETLVNNEAQSMMREFAANLAQQGTKLEEYLERLGKQEADLMLEFTPKALERIKSSLVLREIVKQHNLSIDGNDLDQKIEMMKNMYQHAPEMLAQIESKEYREHMISTLLSHKVLDFVKEQTGHAPAAETTEDTNTDTAEDTEAKAESEKTKTE